MAKKKRKSKRIRVRVNSSRVPKTARGIAKLIRKALRMSKRGRVIVRVKKAR